MADAFGSPTWTELNTIAAALSEKFNIPDRVSLANHLSTALVTMRVDREEIIFVRVQGAYHILDSAGWEYFNDMIGLSGQLLHLLDMKAPANLPDEKTERLRVELISFLNSFAPEYVHQPNISKTGIKTRRPKEARPFVTYLARQWRCLTGEKPVAYDDNVSNEPRGSFWHFTLAACNAVGIEPPSIDSVEEWIRSLPPETSA